MDNIQIFLKGLNYSLNKTIQSIQQAEEDYQEGLLTDDQLHGARKYLKALKNGLESSILDYKKIDDQLKGI